MSTRTLADRAALSISGAKLNKEITLKVDENILEACKAQGIFHLGHKRAESPILSQWLFVQMSRALKEKAEGPRP